MLVDNAVHTYDVEWNYDEPLTVQVVETDETAVLFGAGTEETADKIEEIARGHDVKVVLVEHGDVDHYEGVPALREAVPDIEVAIPAQDATILEGEGINIDHRLEADRTYWGIETIAAPGHTPGNMAYLYGDVLLAGDTVVGAESIFAADENWTGPFATCTPDYNDDDEATRKNVRTLLDYEFDAVLVSHGENVTNGGKEAIKTLVDDLS
jgi:glyoxylase-like metal-dependent hydrolase (beta-lactamase superfamily II)